MAEEQPKESANPAGEVIEEVNEPSMSKEEAIALAEQNTKLGDTFAAKDQLMEAVDAYAQALEYAEKAYGERAPETGRCYHVYGSRLMQLSNRQTEEAFSDTIVEAMSAQSQEGAPKITTNDLELAAAEHADDFEEAWSALETARMIFEKSEDHLATAKVRLSLGDACSDVEQWDDAAKEYGQAATILEELEPNGRRTCEALFLWGLALQMLQDRAGCVKAICQARDAMKRLIESLPETADPKEKEEYEGFLVDLSSKADEVLLEATWTNHEEVDRKLAGEDQEDEQEEEEEAESNKRLIDDNDDGEQLESEAEKKRKIAPDSEEPPKE